jgi:hypothetical protein
MLKKAAVGKMYIRAFFLLPLQKYLCTVADGKMGSFGAVIPSDSNIPNS